MNKLMALILIALTCLMLWGCGQSASNSPSQTSSQSKTTDSASSQLPSDAINKAAYDGDIDTVAEILKTNPNPDARDAFGGTALHAAMFQKNMDIVKMLINYGFDVNAVGPANGYTPLHDAVWNDNADAIKLLLANGANPNIKANNGLTPLELAKKDGKTDLIPLFQ